jgi:anti-sigma factor RsiW
MQITDRDWAQLSAYIDGELSGRELRQVRKKIQTDPLLQAALEQLKITKQILQTAPRIPAPRNPENHPFRGSVWQLLLCHFY